jgi:hypothetical protein
MPRELGDVLHYLLPESGRPSPQRPDPPEPGRPGDSRPGCVASLVCVPLTPHDVVRGALLWNLAVEASRQGAQVSLVAPAEERCTPWLPACRAPLGVDVQKVEADALGAFAPSAEQAARRAASRGGEVALALAAVPHAWLRGADTGPLSLRWVLLLARPDERELLETWSALEAVAVRAPNARIGASVFGVRTLADARRAFEGLAALAELELQRELVSYGVLIDDVHLSRSIVSQRPIGLEKPGSAAARALADVASMLIEDARDAAASSRRIEA